MLSRGIRYGFVAAGVFLIIVANVWFVQAPDTLQAYTDLFFLNTGKFHTYMLDTFNAQYIVAFILYLNLLEYCVLSEINESPSFISLMQYRCDNRKTFHLLLKEEIQVLVRCIGVTIVTIMAIFFLKGGISALAFKDLVLFLLYVLRLGLSICAFLMVYNMESVLESSTKGLVIVSSGMIALIVLDVISGMHCLTFAGILSIELVMLCVTVVICRLMYRYSLWKIRREK